MREESPPRRIYLQSVTARQPQEQTSPISSNYLVGLPMPFISANKSGVKHLFRQTIEVVSENKCGCEAKVSRRTVNAVSAKQSGI